MFNTAMSEAGGLGTPGTHSFARFAALQHGEVLAATAARAVDRAEAFLQAAGFDRAPWLAVSFAAGIASWFVLAGPAQWIALLLSCLGSCAAVFAAKGVDQRWPFLRIAILTTSLALAAGCVTVWAKSSLVGAQPIAAPLVAELSGTVLSREEQAAESRVRLVLAVREPSSGRAIRVRINVPLPRDAAGATEGARVRIKARLMPPQPPMLPGGRDFARTAWFSQLSATGSALGPLVVVTPGKTGGSLESLKRHLSGHIRGRLSGAPGALAAAFASGDRGSIGEANEAAMRDAGLSHLLSISGLHVSAVIAACYVIALRLLALFPWIALRLRLPLVASLCGALGGAGYTALTGTEVPTVRSCIGALLVMLAMALGREPLSMRLLAVAAAFLLLIWPEAIVGPSFQMSFVSVIAIVALHSCAPVRAFLAPRGEAWWQRGGRQAAMLLITGITIEAALMPIGLFHFHRAGVYGALANVIAIPLTTFVSMPLIALALLADLAGLGEPVWWLAGKSLELLLALAHWTVSQPGSVTLLPAMGLWQVLLFVAGGLWLALWTGRIRLLGLVPATAGLASLLVLQTPDILVSGDGRHIGITGSNGTLLVLRESRSDFARDSLREAAGMDGEAVMLDQWDGARCNPGFCSVVLPRADHKWRLLLSRGRDYVPERELAAACAQADIVIADRWLPRSCVPAVLKADRSLLDRTGGLAINLADHSVTTVAQGQGQHGWWRPLDQHRSRQRASINKQPSDNGPQRTNQ